MVNVEALREMIEPYVKMHYPRKIWEKYMDFMFSEMYLTRNEDGFEAIALRELPECTGTLLFSSINGAFIGVDFLYKKHTTDGTYKRIV